MAHKFQIGDFILVPSLNQLHHGDEIFTLEPKAID
jgi:DNA-binding winged helix-turn-helix (wHTH) protein